MAKKIMIFIIILSVVLLNVGCTKDNSQVDNFIEEVILDEIETPIEEPKFDVMEYLSNEYEFVGEESEGLILVNRDGYYGYAYEEGQLVIPLYFTEATDFINGRAIVAPSQKYGVIDMKGEYIMEPKYGEIEIIDDFILIKGTTTQYTRSIDSYRLYDLDGNEIISDYSSEILIGDSNRITAKILDKENTNFRYSTIFDYKGNLIREYEDGVRVGIFSEGYALIRDGEAKIAVDELYKQYYGLYTYIDIDGNKMLDEYFVEATNFNDGMAIVAEGTCFGDGSGKKFTNWKVINDKFETLYNLGSLGEHTCEGIYHDYVKLNSRKEGYLMVDMKTNEKYGYFNGFQEIHEEDAIIVRYVDTGLYGLYVGGELVKLPEYNRITHEGKGLFILEKGASIEEYINQK